LLDIEDFQQLDLYLEDRSTAFGRRPSYATLAGGVSNRTVLVKWPNGASWVFKQALPRLRVEVDWFSDPARVQTEARALRYLIDIVPPGAITPLIFEDHQENLLAMEAVPCPHENWKSLLLSGNVDAGYVRQFGQILAMIHGKSAHQAEIFREAFSSVSAFESLRVEPYYQYVGERIAEAADFLQCLIRDTRAHRLTFVHGDYSPKNILIYAGKLVLLDHEVAHFGDPAFDVGFSMAHLLSKANHLVAQREQFLAAASLYWKTYRESLLECIRWPDELEPRAVRHALGCLLARVAGRSKLEYLTELERERQRSAVLGSLRKPPDSVDALLNEFVSRVA